MAKQAVELKAGKKKNPKKVRLLKREIAQTLTLIREKELIEQESGRRGKLESVEK